MKAFTPSVGRELVIPIQARESGAATAARLERTAFYSSSRWRKLRAMKLAADPVCQWCNRKAATTVDHIVPRLSRPDLAFVLVNLRSGCPECHSAYGEKSK